MINKMFDGHYRKPPVLCYKRPEPFFILDAAIQTLDKIRSGCTEAEMLLMMDGLLLVSCGTSGADREMWEGIRRVSSGRFC